VKRFARQYNELISGMLSCFDRILFKGYLPLGWGDSMEGFLLGRSKRRRGRPHRGFNPIAEEDLRLFAAIFRGEHALQGIRNQDVRRELYGQPRDRDLRRRCANRVSRLFRRLHVHGLLAKIPRTRRWRLTQRGTLLITMFLQCHYDKYPSLLAALAV